MLESKLPSVLDELSLHELDIILIVFRRCDVRLPVGIWESRLFDILITMPTETAVQSEASNLSSIFIPLVDKTRTQDRSKLSHIFRTKFSETQLYICQLLSPYFTTYYSQWLIASLAKTLKYMKGSVEREKKQAFADKYGDILELFSPHVRVHLLAMISYNVPARYQGSKSACLNQINKDYA